ncbi:MAG: hypothetical protein Q4B22_03010 [Eubacteriales bacterium]|nr:hypothetical protein [Eubacteriales bacterium]
MVPIAPAINGKPEHFRFSLLFIGYLETGSLHRQDKLDLYKHEYAHYMQFHIDIPKEHQWQPGLHGSAWKYCCSLIGAAPTEHYHKNEGTRSHDYDKALKNPWKNKHTALLDIAHRKKEAEDQKNREIRYQIGDTAVHPKFGEGIIEAVEQLQGSVRLHIRFGNELKKIDQKWLERSKYK